ncbi:aminotransferase-like domain-containing protein [Thauera sp. 63]|uniref:aminotransferase-like domain-containing protein n=1 Tax=Thauera sp. 63 TaxID=497321 RepID=UPI0002D014B9|nr:PLP-dependent aminotransferase family protein [Thauera sp. 63]ENO78797.1 putative aminotransferase [Thauera sp. 63]
MNSRQQPKLSERVERLQPSAIREILAVIDRPGMISFAGGLPSAESFPDLSGLPLPREVLQYGASEGEPALRERIAAEVNAIGLRCTAEQVLVLSGSQQGIDLVAKLFIDPGTMVAVEEPTYLAALQVFRFFGARFAPLRPRQALAGLDADAPPALAYAIPSFQNPTGHCYDAAERDALARACDTLGVPLFEDDPYRDLAYDACERTPVCARLERAPWIYQGSFSKTLAPGLRLGYLVASPELMPLLVRLKQAADLHSNRVSQHVVLAQLRSPDRAERMRRVVDAYRRKRDFFAAALQRHFGDLARWQTPPGGLFFWLDLLAPIDTRALLPEAIERGVAFMPGELFFAGEVPAHGTLRLNFSHADEDGIERGLAVLAELVRCRIELPVAGLAEA